MLDLWGPENSVLREKVFEHIFLAELSKVLLLDRRARFEVLRSEFDGFGYDLVVEALGTTRHVQLKATRLGGKRASVDVALSLATKPGGCVIWFMVDERQLSIGPYYWLGGGPGDPMPSLGDKVARHTRGVGERMALREVAKGKFKKFNTIAEVVTAMFGEAERNYDGLLRDHLAKRGHMIGPELVPKDLTWARSIEIAHMIDGYELAEAAGLGDPFSHADAVRAEAERTGRWRGSTLALWVALFMEHRREHLGGPLGITLSWNEGVLLDELCRELSAALRA